MVGFVRRIRRPKAEFKELRLVEEFDVGAGEAAVRIQSCWRGKKARYEVEGRRIRQKPKGYYTHTLGLTYISHVRGAGVEIPLRRRLYLLIEIPRSSLAAQAVAGGILAAIGLSMLGFVLETVPSLHSRSPEGWYALEAACTTVFTVEYFCRLVVCPEAGISPRAFLLMPVNMLDFMAVLPFYTDLLLMSCGLDDAPAFDAFRLVRLLRVIRVLKLARYSSGMRLTARALVASSQALSVLVFLLCMGVVLFSSAMYHLEKLSCPDREALSEAERRGYAEDCADEFYHGVSPRFGLCCTEDGAPNDFPSIIAAAWWSMATMTTLGYGDVYPKTALGKCVGFIVMLGGMVIIALPVAIVSQKFQAVYDSHYLEVAKFAAARRMKVNGEQWSLVPTSDVLMRLRHLKIKDSSIASSVVNLAAHLEEVWEHREILMRDRKIEIERQDEANEAIMKLLSGIEASLSSF